MTDRIDEQVAADARDPNANGIPPWTWPEWLTCEAIAKDEDGRWYGYASDDIEVDVRSGRWTTSDEFFELAMFVRLDLPGNVQWDYSAIRNPHKK